MHYFYENFIISIYAIFIHYIIIVNIKIAGVNYIFHYDSTTFDVITWIDSNLVYLY